MKQTRHRRKPQPDAGSQPQTKWCTICGRQIEWRRKWRRDWDQVKYCSKRCRQSSLKPMDHDLEETILYLLKKRPRGATICPSEAARQVHPTDENGSWRNLTPSARNAARRLAARGRIVFLQAGHQVDPTTAKGPVRLKLK